ncbi:hypothetical protein RHMOL_Rhmol02G0258700 [Rhododendron molle]|uniref:Uncharacterized protein n=1 Tax=Rhododendron molle TaxID=49168 RepID=A0ACC0PU03_RHOML|nr:hypothetical protein RHMOL_Rhmol02G0258700 [Rhododendron molle]
MFPGAGSVTQIQLPVRQIQNITYSHSLKKRFRCRCFRFLTHLHVNVTSSEIKASRKLLKSFINGDEYPSTTPEDDHPGSNQSDICKNLNAFYQFSRPYTVIGTALVPSILMNIYVVGLNQLFDVDIDKVNKPYLPLASGEFSMELGWAIVSTFLLMSFTLGIMFQSPPLLCALIVSFLLGSAYSIELPFLRWKRNAFLAATCIVIVRAIVVQLAFFIHIQKYVLGRPIMLTKSFAFAVAFMCLFSTIIALFKVFWLGISMLLMGYGSAMVVGASSSCFTNKLVTVLGHAALASSLWLRAQSVDLDSKESTSSLYMFIWKATILCRVPSYSFRTLKESVSLDTYSQRRFSIVCLSPMPLCSSGRHYCCYVQKHVFNFERCKVKTTSSIFSQCISHGVGEI